MFKVYWPEPFTDCDGASDSFDVDCADMPIVWTRDSRFVLTSKVRVYIVVRAGTSQCTCV